jgi:hypothetical protein
MRKRGNRLAGKGATGSGRAAVLNFLAGLEALELRPLLELLLEPLAPAFAEPGDAAEPPSKRRRVAEPAAEAAEARARHEAAAAGELAALDGCRLLPAPWWAQHLGSRGLAWWLAAVDGDALAALPLRLRVGPALAHCTAPGALLPWAQLPWAAPCLQACAWPASRGCLGLPGRRRPPAPTLQPPGDRAPTQCVLSGALRRRWALSRALRTC